MAQPVNNPLSELINSASKSFQAFVDARFTNQELALAQAERASAAEETRARELELQAQQQQGLSTRNILLLGGGLVLVTVFLVSRRR